MATYYWGDSKPEPPMTPDARVYAAIALLFARDLFQSGCNFTNRLAMTLFSAANAELKRAEFREKAVQEMEALVSGRYWEVDADEGLYIASIDEIELEDEEEDEELD